MENASKALLIAAAVLVVIILIAVGMKIYSSTTGAQKVGLDTGETISEKAGDATDLAISEIKNGKGQWVQNKTTITNSETNQTLYVGHKVNYDCGVSGYSGRWKILGVENGNILLMSTKNIENITLDGKEDYLTEGTKKLKNACKPYLNKKYANEARSIKMEDIYRAIEYTPSGIITYTYTMINGQVKRNDLESPSWETSFEDVNGHVLTANNSISVTTSTNIGNVQIPSPSLMYDLFDSKGDWYWICSPCIYVYNPPASTGVACWGFNYTKNCKIYSVPLYDSRGYSKSYTYGVRAVVKLKSNVKLSQSSPSEWNLEI